MSAIGAAAKEIPFKELCRVPMFLCGVLAQVLVFGGVAFGQPTLALHLASYEGFTNFWIGMYFAMPAVAYIVNTLCVASYCKVLSRRGVIFVGLALFSMGLYLAGTSPMLGVKDSPSIILTGLMLVGFSAAMITIPLVPEVIHSIEHKLPDLAGEELNNVVSGYFNSSIGIGEALGPITSGMLVATLGFRKSNDVVGTLFIIFTLLFFVVNGNFSLLVPSSSATPEDADDNFFKYKDFESAGPASSTRSTMVETTRSTLVETDLGIIHTKADSEAGDNH